METHFVHFRMFLLSGSVSAPKQKDLSLEAAREETTDLLVLNGSIEDNELMAAEQT